MAKGYRLTGTVTYQFEAYIRANTDRDAMNETARDIFGEDYVDWKTPDVVFEYVDEISEMEWRQAHED